MQNCTCTVYDNSASRLGWFPNSSIPATSPTACIWADSGYAGKLVAWVKALRPFGRRHLDIVRRRDKAEGFKLLPKRWIVERTFGWLVKSRRLRLDYEVKTTHSEAMIQLAMFRLVLVAAPGGDEVHDGEHEFNFHERFAASVNSSAQKAAANLPLRGA